MTFKKILVPLDGSSNSEQILGWVVGLATVVRAEIIVLAVVDPAHFTLNRTPALSSGSGSAPTSDEKANLDAAVEQVRSYLDAETGKIRTKNRSVTSEIATGRPAEAILEHADKVGADMIAMATHRGNVIERGVLGSVTDTVLRSSPIPVLAVRPDGVRSFTGNASAPAAVIVPLDGSALAEESVPIAIDLAERCSAQMVFIHAVHLPSIEVSGPGAEYYGVDYGVGGHRREALEYLSAFVRQAEAKGLKARAHAALGDAAARIIEESKNVDGALVIVSSHGRGGWKRLFLGSVADKIVRASHHPVLVLKHVRE